MGNVHQVVVDDVCEIIGGIAVGLQQDLVLQLFIFNGNLPEYRVLEGGGTLCRHLLPDHIGGAGIQQALDFLGGQIPAVTVIAAEAIFLMEGFQPFLGAEAVVGLAFPDKLLCIGAIGVLPLALDIGAIFSANIGAFIVVQAHLLQGVVDHIHCALHQPFLVGILNAQDEFPLLGFGDEIFKQGGAQVAHVHKARGAGRETSAYQFVFHVISLSYNG